MMCADERIIIKHLKNFERLYPHFKESRKLKELAKKLEKTSDRKRRMYL